MIDVIIRDLRKILQRAEDKLALLLPCLVQQLSLTGDWATVSIYTSGVSVAHHTEALKDVLGEVFLVDGDRPVSAIPCDTRTEHYRYAPKMRHLETVRKALSDIVGQLLVVAQSRDIVRTECRSGETGLILKHGEVVARSERAYSTSRGVTVNGAKSVLPTSPGTVEALLGLHHKGGSGLVVGFEAGAHLDVDIVPDVSVEARRLHVQHEYSATMLASDC